RGISYVHNIFSWPATDPARLALDNYFVEHIETAEALVTTGQRLASALASTECVQLGRQEDLIGGHEGRRMTQARARPDDTLHILATIPEGLLFRLPRMVQELQSGSAELQAAVRGSGILRGVLSAGDSECESECPSQESEDVEDARNTGVCWKGSQMRSDIGFWSSIPSLCAEVEKYIQDEPEPTYDEYYESDYGYYGESSTEFNSDTESEPQ
ncbi:hypothetical protein KIPB_013496, partial [Kipferlia bialata]